MLIHVRFHSHPHRLGSVEGQTSMIMGRWFICLEKNNPWLCHIHSYSCHSSIHPSSKPSVCLSVCLSNHPCIARLWSPDLCHICCQPCLIMRGGKWCIFSTEFDISKCHVWWRKPRVTPTVVPTDKGCCPFPNLGITHYYETFIEYCSLRSPTVTLKGESFFDGTCLLMSVGKFTQIKYIVRW